MQHERDGDVERLPSFITGGQQQPQQPQGQNGPQSSHGQSGPQNGPNGPNGYDGPDRFPLHRRRRRHRGGGRDYAMDRSADRPMGGENAMPGDGDGQSPAPGLPPASDE
jgi:hypothetical protein